MKLTVFLLLVSVVSVLANKSYSQTKMLTLNMREATVKEVLKSIEEQSEFYFLYSEELIDVKRKVNVTIKNKNIEQALNLIFEGTNVDYSIRDRIIVLTTPEVTGDNFMVQQQNSVSGTVTDDTGQPLPGVTILVKGTTQGTVTNTDGNYSLSNIPKDATLQFSFIGMRSQEVIVGSQTTINVEMAVDAIGIEEVVAVGYGTMKKSDLTGSVSSVSQNKLEEKSAVNVLQSIQGNIAGVSIRQSSSVPGASPDIYVRGLNSISASNAPLVIVDGIPGDLGQLNPNDIASISVLKDASSSAIYGARGANGVIIVTTKRGSGKAKVTYNVYYGVAQTTKELDLMGPEKWLMYRERDTELTGKPSEPVDVLTEEEYQNYTRGITTDWQKLTFKNASIKQHNLSISGGENTLHYYFSANYVDHDNIVGDYNLKNKSIRVNISKDLGNWLKIENNLQVLKKDRKGSTGDFSNAIRLSPYASPYDPEGNYLIWPIESKTEMRTNPLSYLHSINLGDEMHVFENINANIKLPIEGLEYKANYGIKSDNSKSNEYNGLLTPSGNKRNREASKNTSSNYNWIFENIVHYNRVFGKHAFDVTGLYSAEKSKSESFSETVFGFINDALLYNNLGAAQNYDPPVSNAVEWAMNSMMGRINYNYGEKYLLTLTYRRDGYSAFGENKKYGNFPSAAFAWRLSQEKFMANLDPLSRLTLRISWGKNGNQAISPYSSQAKVAQLERAYPFGPGHEIALYGFGPSTIANRSLGWETTESINIGIDFGFFKNRISGSIEYYQAHTSDLLLTRGIPYATGFSSIYDNIGKTRNDGVDFTLNSINVSNRNGFSWTSNLNLSYNKNQIIDLYGDKKDDLGNEWFIGRPVNVYYDYAFDGIWQETDDIANSYMPLMQPGTTKVKDLSGPDGVPDNAITADDRTIVGNRDPNFLWGLSNNFKYKNFDLSILFYGVHGVTGYTDMFARDEYNNRLDLDFWLPEVPSNLYASVSPIKSRTYISAGGYRDASFVRLKDLTFGYTLPEDLSSKLRLDVLRFYFNATNLFTITEWPLYDPETLSNTRPMTRNIIFGMNLSF